MKEWVLIMPLNLVDTRLSQIDCWQEGLLMRLNYFVLNDWFEIRFCISFTIFFNIGYFGYLKSNIVIQCCEIDVKQTICRFDMNILTVILLCSNLNFTLKSTNIVYGNFSVFHFQFLHVWIFNQVNMKISRIKRIVFENFKLLNVLKLVFDSWHIEQMIIHQCSLLMLLNVSNFRYVF